MDRTNDTPGPRGGRTRRSPRPGADPKVAGTSAHAVAARFLRSARLCRSRDLEQVSILVELVRHLSELIHSLQKERGASSIYLGSNGAQFSQRLQRRVSECLTVERAVRERLEHIDEKLDRMSSGARFYTRMALALRALDSLPTLRREITALSIAPQDSVRAFTQIIGPLIAVGFEVGDIAADPTVSRALVALVNFAQAKEYAGQERATVGAALSTGQFDAAQLQRVRELVHAQDHGFRIFCEFSDNHHAEAFRDAADNLDALAVASVRETIGRLQPQVAVHLDADDWYQHATRRIDALHRIEVEMSLQLGRLCNDKLSQARRAEDDSSAECADEIPVTAPVGMLLTGAEPATDESAPRSGFGPYLPLNAGLQPMRSILSVIQAQSQRIDAVSAQLESARAALGERKTVDRAKGLLMSSRNLSEKEAYTLMRETAMRQNKRIVDIAESIISMADILKG